MRSKPSLPTAAWGYGATIIVAALLPLAVSSFVLQNVLAVAAWEGIVAMSLVFLSKFGGMVSLAQVAVYGVSSYTVAVCGVSHHLPWYLTVLCALGASSVCAFVFGLLCVRSYGIYFLMVTLLLGLVVYFLAKSNETITNGSTGIVGVYPPHIGGSSLTSPVAEYALDLGVAALLLFGLTALMKTQFGLALQGCRDNPRKMRALGYSVGWYRVLAFTVAGFVAGVGGVLGAWYNGLVAPGILNLTTIVGVLVIAVLGGMNSMPGVFGGAVLYLAITTYASSVTARYNTLIGVLFLLVVMFAPNGLAGLFEKIHRRLRLAPNQMKVMKERERVDTQ